MFTFKRLFIILMGMSFFLSTAYATSTNPEKISETVLFKTDHSWNGAKYVAYPSGQPEITMVKIKIPPHTVLPWHTHPMPNFAYMLSGTLHVENKDGKHITIKAGDTLAETVNTVHRGRTDDQPAELIVVYVGVKNMPTVIPYK